MTEDRQNSAYQLGPVQTVLVYLVRMLDVHTEARFLQQAPLGLDDLVLEVDVVLDQHQRVDVPATQPAHTGSPLVHPTRGTSTAGLLGQAC